MIPSDASARAKLCLKARPTQAQLADRLRPVDGVWPDGLELYLDVADIADMAAMDGVVSRVQEYLLPAQFSLLIEGPVGSLDGGFFDSSRASEADIAVVDRLAALADRLRVRAVNIHVIAPSDDLSRLSLAHHDELLSRCVPLLRHFVDVTVRAGAIPTVENMPPVLRMRRGGFFFTPIGMASEDLRWLVQQVPGLKILPDTSHAGLYLAARRAAAGDGAASPDAAGQSWLNPLLQFVRQLPAEAPDLPGFFASFAPHVVSAQISNASGILGEGLPYAEGDYDLTPTIQWLGSNACYLITETLEAANDDARYMRDALRQMRAVLG